MQAPSHFNESDVSEDIRQARFLYESGKLADAEAKFNEAIAAGEASSEAYYGLGLVQFALGQSRAAWSSLSQSIALGPQNADAYYRLGQIAEAEGANDQAQAAYTRALAIEPEHQAAAGHLTNLHTHANAVEGKGMISPRVSSAPGSTRPVFATANTAEGQLHRPAPSNHYGGAGSQYAAAQRTSWSTANLETNDTDFGSRRGISALLSTDTSPLAQQTLRLLNSLNMSRTPRLSAYLGSFLPSSKDLIAIVALFGAELGLSFLLDPRHKWPTTVNLEVVLVAWIVLRLIVNTWIAITVKSTQIQIEDGRIRITSGVFSRKSTLHELYRVREVQLVQSFWNRLTGDGAVVLVGEVSGKTSLIGLAQIDELRSMFETIRDAVLALRTGPWGKGVIY